MCDPLTLFPLRLIRLALAVGLALLTSVLVACVQSRPVVTPDGRLVQPEALSGARTVLPGLLALPDLTAARVEQARSDLGETVSIERLEILAATRLPAFRQLKAELLSLEGLRDQAIAQGNPALELYADDVPADLDRIGRGRFGAIYRHPIELSNRLSAAGRRAEHQLKAAEFEALSTSTRLRLEVRLAFVAYWVAYHRELIANEIVTARDAQVAAWQQKLDSGLAAESELWAVQAVAAEARLVVGERTMTLATARQRVRLSVGDALLTLGTPVADPKGPALPSAFRNAPGESDDAAPAFDARRWAAEHPRALAANQRVLAAESHIEEVGSEPSGAWTLAAGAEYDGEDDIVRWHVGVEIPLPLMDQAQGAIRAARARREAAIAQTAGVQAELLAELFATEERARAAADRLAVYDTELLPRLADAEALAVRQRLAGAITDAEVAAARVVRLQAQNARWQALADFASASYRLAALVGE